MRHVSINKLLFVEKERGPFDFGLTGFLISIIRGNMVHRKLIIPRKMTIIRLSTKLPRQCNAHYRSSIPSFLLDSMPPWPDKVTKVSPARHKSVPQGVVGFVSEVSPDHRHCRPPKTPFCSHSIQTAAIQPLLLLI